MRINRTSSLLSPVRCTRNAAIPILLSLSITLAACGPGGASLEEELASIRADGYPATLQELDAWYIEVPPAENAAVQYALAFDAFERIAGTTDSLTELCETVNALGPGRNLPSGSLGSINDYLSQCGEVFSHLGRAVKLDESRYPANLRQGSSAELPHLSPLRDVARLYALVAAVAVESKDSATVLKSQSAMLSIAASLREEPLLISQLVRLHVNGMAIISLERSLSAVEFSELELKLLSRRYGSAEYPKALARSLAGELCLAIDYAPSGLTNDEEKPFSTGEKVTVIRALKPVLALEYEPIHTWTSELDIISAHQETVTKNHARATDHAVAVTRGVEVFVRDAAGMRVARSALAVERYRLAEGTIPESLDVLTPDYLRAVPIDPYDGEPLRYEKKDRGYLVYSVGSNLIDEGGVEESREADGSSTGDLIIRVYR